MLKKTPTLFFISLSILFLLPFFILCFYAWPSSDDYAMSVIVAESGNSVFKAAVDLYYTWAGRYSTLAGSLLSPAVVEYLWLYRIILFLTLLFLLISIKYFWSSVLTVSNNNIWLITLAFMLLWIQIIPGIADNFYWFSGVVVYTWPLIVFFFFAGQLLRNKYTVLIKIVLSIAVFVFIGFNEIAATLILMLILLIALHSEIKKTVYQYWLLLLTICAGIALLLISPGNAKRMILFSDSGDFIIAVRISFISVMKLNVIGLKDISLWLIALMAFQHLQINNFNNKLHILTKLHPIKIIIISQAALFLLMFIPAISMGLNPPLRVYGFLTPIWMLMILWLLVSIRNRISEERLSAIPRFSGLGRYILGTIIAVSIMASWIKIPGDKYVFGGNVPQAWHDIIFSAKDYNIAMYEREKLITNAKENDNLSLSVPPVNNPPKTIFFIDITDDSNNWINSLYARHYGLERVWINNQKID